MNCHAIVTHKIPKILYIIKKDKSTQQSEKLTLPLTDFDTSLITLWRFGAIFFAITRLMERA